MKEKLEKYGQSHLYTYYETLEGNNKSLFLEDLNKIDYEFVNNLFREENLSDGEGEITPVTPYICDGLENKDEYDEIGKKIVSDGEFALITMAGGQGTRLGFNGPKGTYVLGEKSLFEIFADKIRGKNVPWLIMTSEENDKDTKEFFDKNNNFGLDNVTFFTQRMLPLVDEKGKILIGENGFIKFGADGSGGIYNALSTNNLIEKLASMNVKWVFINGVDNCLTHPVDYTLLGLVSSKGYNLASKSVVKDYPEEKVGVLCYNNCLPHVIEYINLDEKLRYEKNSEGEYLYADGHVLANLMSVSLLEKIARNPLKYYKAHKKSSYINELGKVVNPSEPNSYKFECFLFDAFKAADDFLILRVKREDEFAPLKNSNEAGVDCPKTALELLRNFEKRNK